MASHNPLISIYTYTRGVISEWATSRAPEGSGGPDQNIPCPWAPEGLATPVTHTRTHAHTQARDFERNASFAVHIYRAEL